MTGAAGLTQLNVGVIGVTDNTDGSLAVQTDVTQLAGGQTNHALAVLLSHQLSADACGTNQLRALARVQLDVVDHGTNRDVLNRQAVARLDVGILGGDDLVADLQTLGSEDVCLLAVLILDESDVGRAVRVVLDGLDFCENVELLTLEVNDTVLLLVAAADVANGDAAVAVAAGGLLDLFEKALLGLHLRQTLIVEHSHISARGRRRVESLNSHLEFQLLDSLLSGWLPHTHTCQKLSLRAGFISPRRGTVKVRLCRTFTPLLRDTCPEPRSPCGREGGIEKSFLGNFSRI